MFPVKTKVNRFLYYYSDVFSIPIWSQQKYFKKKMNYASLFWSYFSYTYRVLEPQLLFIQLSIKFKNIQFSGFRFFDNFTIE